MSAPVPDVDRSVPFDEAVSALMDLLRRREDGSSDRWRRQGALVVVDGPTGAGKTTLAHSLVGALARGNASYGARVLELEAVVPGWDGLAEGVRRCAGLLADLDCGRPAHAPRWNWHSMRPGGRVSLPPLAGGLLVLEGCGALAAAAQPLRGVVAVRVWVTAPPRTRRARIAARDAYGWDVSAWEVQERSLARAWRNRAGLGPDLVVDSRDGPATALGTPTESRRE